MKVQKKYVFLFCFLVILCVFLSGCDFVEEDASGIEAETLGDSVLAMEGSDKILIYEVANDEDLLAFLNVIDDSRFKILGICLNTYYDPDRYSVTYQKLSAEEEPSQVKNLNEFQIFKSKTEKEYKNFIANLDVNSNKIYSILVKAGYKDDYIVIYR